MILVTAANGQLGGRIARCILDQLEDGSRLAVSVRDAATASRLAARRADVRQADFNLPETLAAAFRGVARLVLIPSPAPAAERIRQHRNVVAAATVTLGHGHEGKTHALTGPQAHGFAEVAAILSSVHGTEVVYEDLTVDDFAAEMEAAGFPPYLIEGSIGMYTLTAEGRFDTVSDAIPRLTGRPAEGLEDFLERIPPG